MDALETVHEQGIYPLDIKPENIVISGEDKVVLIDHLSNFWYARLMERLSAIPCMVGSVELKNPRVLPCLFHSSLVYVSILISYQG